MQGLIARQFGLEAALPLLRKGKKGIEEYEKKVREFGGVRTQASIKTAENFALSLNYLDIATQGLKNSIGDKLIPIIEPLVTKLASWIAANRDLISTRIAEFVKGFAEWLDKVDFNNVLNGISGFIKKIGDTVEAIGGWKVAAIGLAVVMNGSLIASVVNLSTSLLSLSATTIPAAVRGLMAIQTAMAGSNVAGIAMLGTVTGLIGKLGLIGLAGAAGYGIGTGLNWGINKMLEWGTGEEGATLGGKIYDWTHPNQNVPLGIRNNNPMNLQPGGREAKFFTPEQGIANGVSNILRNYQGLTLGQFVHKYAPGNAPGNSPKTEAAYLADLSSKTGLSADQVPNLRDPKMLSLLTASIIRHENGQNPYDKSMIDNTVSHVLVEFKNAPPGTTATAKTKGGASVPVKVSHTMAPISAG